MNKILLFLILLTSISAQAADFTISVQSEGSKVALYKRATNERVGLVTFATAWSGVTAPNGDLFILGKQTIYFDSSSCLSTEAYAYGSMPVGSILYGTDSKFYKVIAPSSGGAKYPWFNGSGACNPSTQNNNGYMVLEQTTAPVMVDIFSAASINDIGVLYYKKEN
jgi:hypothetical protein